MSEPSVYGSNGNGANSRPPIGRAAWLAAAILGALFGAAVWFGFYGWNLVPNEMGAQGYLAMALGILFTAALGGGLMALLFWSHKKGFDR